MDAFTEISARSLKTPVGVLHVAACAESVLYVELPSRRSEPPFARWLRGRLLSHGETPVLRAALHQLGEYFDGKRRDFDLPLDAAGTEFQRRVWSAVATIPFGSTAAYGQIAAGVGTPQMARAVGAAVAANPIPIIVPCHRVTAADGSMCGYSGGLRLKVWLLHHEGVLLT